MISTIKIIENIDKPELVRDTPKRSSRATFGKWALPPNRSINFYFIVTCNFSRLRGSKT